MRFLILQAYWQLIRFEVCLGHRDFAALHRLVRTTPVRRGTFAADTTTRICSAIDYASIGYWKQVQCLQRSAATTCLLRRHGVAARLVIGARQMPFRAHAWVEVDDQVINDMPHRTQMFEVLERC
jgi:Transglutaminase-like superfamily.